MLTNVTRALFTLLIVIASATLVESAEVKNSATPVHAVQTMPMEELWRIGGEEDEENLLGVVDKVFADDADQIYLLDIQLVEIQVFDEEGIYSRSLGKQGDGPGEIRRIADALFLPDGTVVNFASTLGTITPYSTTVQDGAAHAVISDLPVGVEGEFLVIALVQGSSIISDPPIELYIEVRQ